MTTIPGSTSMLGLQSLMLTGLQITKVAEYKAKPKAFGGKVKAKICPAKVHHRFTRLLILLTVPVYHFFLYSFCAVLFSERIRGRSPNFGDVG